MNLTEIRNSKNIRQAELAKRLGVAVSTYNMYENGERTVPAHIAKKIAKILEVDVNEIFLPEKFTVSKRKVNE